MRESKAEIYFHFVWTTHRRQPLLTRGTEVSVYHCIEQEVQRFQTAVLALGGMPDHVHLAVRMPTNISPAQLMKQVKGVSSHFANQQLASTAKGVSKWFGWQEGYGVFSLSRSHVTRVTAYIKDQKSHHATGNLWNDWEPTDETISRPQSSEDGRRSHSDG